MACPIHNGTIYTYLCLIKNKINSFQLWVLYKTDLRIYATKAMESIFITKHVLRLNVNISLIDRYQIEVLTWIQLGFNEKIGINCLKDLRLKTFKVFVNFSLSFRYFNVTCLMYTYRSIYLFIYLSLAVTCSE